MKKKCQVGDNDSYICSLIRENLVEKFISYVNHKNIPLELEIEPSIYETNSLLFDNKEVSLIEYAAFSGSILIIQYLKYNKIPLTSDLWYYLVHSNNAELIHFLESELFEETKSNDQFNDVLIESIKCHHNEISNYIMDYLIKQTIMNDRNKFNEIFGYGISCPLNFFLYPNDFDFIICKL